MCFHEIVFGALDLWSGRGHFST